MNQKYISNFTWRLAERWFSQFVSLLVTMVLARLLDPSANGTVAIVSVFISLCSIFVDSGFGGALIQKKDADDLDFSSVFYFNIAVCTLLYILLFFAAPLIAHIYEIPILTPLIRVQSIGLILSGVSSIQVAYVSKYLLFKRYFFSTLGSTIISAVAGITVAYFGYGVWALVIQSVTAGALNLCFLWLSIRWRPKKMFSFSRLKSLFSYGSKLLVSSLLYTGYADLRQLIIGKFYSTADLAFYNKAYTVPSMLNNGISTSIGSVLFPAMVTVQDNPEKIKAMLKRTLLLYSYVLTPIFVGLMVCAEPVITLLFSAKWLPSVPFLQIFCLIYIFEGLSMANQNALKAIGRSDLTLKIEFIKTPLYIVLLLASIPFGVMAVAYSFVIGVAIAQLICTGFSKKLFGYSLWAQLRDILPNILLCAFMGGCVWLVSLLNLHYILTPLIQVPLGVGLYILGSVLSKNESFYYVLNLIKSFGVKFSSKNKKS